jgi:tRNA(fMet)-specific endonuclease VapC
MASIRPQAIAPMTYLLDTNICIAIINEQPAELLQCVIHAGRESLDISSVTVAQLAFGISKSRRSDSRAELGNFIPKFLILNWEQSAASFNGNVRKTLEAKAQRLDKRDLLLACQALAVNTTIPIYNMCKIEQGEGLKLESWVV